MGGIHRTLRADWLEALYSPIKRGKCSTQCIWWPLYGKIYSALKDIILLLVMDDIRLGINVCCTRDECQMKREWIIVFSCYGRMSMKCHKVQCPVDVGLKVRYPFVEPDIKVIIHKHTQEWFAGGKPTPSTVWSRFNDHNNISSEKWLGNFPSRTLLYTFVFIVKKSTVNYFLLWIF